MLARGIDPAERPVLARLVTDDMAGLLRFAQDRGYRERSGGCISKCDLCLDLRRHLFCDGDFPELQPAQFYEVGTAEEAPARSDKDPDA